MASKKYLDYNGLDYFWDKIKNAINEANQPEIVVLRATIDEEYVRPDDIDNDGRVDYQEFLHRIYIADMSVAEFNSAIEQATEVWIYVFDGSTGYGYVLRTNGDITDRYHFLNFSGQINSWSSVSGSESKIVFGSIRTSGNASVLSSPAYIDVYITEIIPESDVDVLNLLSSNDFGYPIEDANGYIIVDDNNNMIITMDSSDSSVIN